MALIKQAPDVVEVTLPKLYCKRTNERIKKVFKTRTDHVDNTGTGKPGQKILFCYAVC